MSTSKPLRQAPREPSEISAQQARLVLPHFTSDDAFTIGVAIRTRIRSLTSTPAVVNITSTNSDNLLFHCTTSSGITPDNDIWVARKRKTVKRFGVSSWALGRKYDGDEALFAKKFGLGDRAGEYAIHGGGVPVRVRGVEGTVAVIVVSGLKQEEDHQVVVEALEEFITDAGAGAKEVGETKGTMQGEVESKKPIASTEEARVMVEEQKADGAVYAS